MHQNLPINTGESLSSPDRSRAIMSGFDRAAAHYDHHADVQQRAAIELGSKIQARCDPATIHRVLEIGCGTGFLTEQLLGVYGRAAWTITDISGHMIRHCRQKLQPLLSREQQSSGQIDFRVMDAHAIDLTEKFDLICSNLAFQWFPDLLAVVIDLVDRLRPGGTLIFNTLGSESFRYWKMLDQQGGGHSSATKFPPFDSLTQELASGCHNHFGLRVKLAADQEQLCNHHASFLEFLRALKMIGASTPMQNGPTPIDPTSIAHLRNMLRLSRKQDPQGIEINYQVITFTIRRLAPNIR